MGRYFGTNGIRGILGQDGFTLKFLCSMTMAIGTHIMTKMNADIHNKQGDARNDMLVGYDGRSTGPLICNAVSAALGYAGIDCMVAGMVSTPCIEYEVKHRHAGGIMITASHNPPQYNGIKVVAADGIEISRKDESAIEDMYDAMRPPAGRMPARPKRWGSISSYSHTDNMLYVPGIVSQVDSAAISKAGLSVAIDPGNGVQGTYAMQLCRDLGCKHVMINDTIDGQFSGRGPEPTPENLQGLSHLVQKRGADVGVAFDGDGDRSMFCDEQGRIIAGDRSALILVRHVLGKSIGDNDHDDTAATVSKDIRHNVPQNSAQKEIISIATCLNSSSAAEKVAADLGASVTRTKIGSVEVSQCMRETGALVGYEENGGFMYGRHNAVRDGCMTLALMLEALAYAKNTLQTGELSCGIAALSHLAESLPQTYTAKTKVRCADPGPVLEHMSQVLDVSDDRDGLKVVLGKTGTSSSSSSSSSSTSSSTSSGPSENKNDESQRWVLIRPSGTEPALRIYAEAPTQQEADSTAKEYARMLLACDGVTIY